jgi:hypothetical protein
VAQTIAFGRLRSPWSRKATKNDGPPHCPVNHWTLQLTSSLSAIAYGHDDPNSHLFTEADWTDPDHKDNVPYTRSKTIAKHLIHASLASR